MDEEKRMTVKEIAQSLGTAESTIRNLAKEMFPESIENGKTTYLNELQTTQLKQNLVPRTLTLKSKVDSANTELEIAQMTMKVIYYWQSRAKELEEQNKVTENRLNRLIHNNRTFTTTEIAKELQFKSAQELNAELARRGIIYKDSRGVWLLNSEYSNKGFMNLKSKEVNGITVHYGEWTGLGRDWLIGIFQSNEE